MAPTIAPRISPTLRTGVGSTVGAKDGSLAAESGPAAAKCQKTAGGKIPQGSSNLDGVRRRVNPPRLATAKAAAGAKGPEGISSDNDKELHDAASSDDEDALHDEATSAMLTRRQDCVHWQDCACEGC
jgi:hypothetical protein